MVKKTLLSLAVATAIAGLTGCNVSSTDKYDNDVVTAPVEAGGINDANARPADATSPVFAVSLSKVPLAIDFLFADAKVSDGTANTEVTVETFPVTTGINKLAGFSTTSPLYIAFDGALAPASVLPNQTVFLVKLLNSADDPSIDALDMDTIIAAAMNRAGALAGVPFTGVAAIEADVVTLKGDNGQDVQNIRILPTKPLETKTKYLVIITDGVKNSTGKAIYPSSEFQSLATVDGNIDMPVEKLTAVRDAIQGWQKLASGFLKGSSVSNKPVLSYTFTTDGSQDVLKAYAAPGLFVQNNLTVEKAVAVTDEGAGVPVGFNVVARKVYLASPPTSNYNPTPQELQAVSAAAITATKQAPAYKVALFGAIANADQAAVGNKSLAEVASAPAPRDVALIPQTNVDAALNAALENVNGWPAGTVTIGASPKRFGIGTDEYTRYIQGQIELPNFLGLPKLTTLSADAETMKANVAGALRSDANWTANTTVGAILDGALKQKMGTTPPKDVDGVSTNVTYRYPFPQSVGTNTAPLLITLPANIDYSAGGTNPAGSDCSGAGVKFPVVIYVHGITGSRANMLPYSAAFTANCVASVAIDLPLHGIAPQSTDRNGATVANALLPFSVEPGNAAKTGSPWAGVAAQIPSTPFANLRERHGNIYQDGNLIRHSINFDDKVGDSGSAFINLQNFGRSGDNLRQAVVDLLNLNASLGNINTALGDKLDTSNVFVVGHSLGSIVASTFVAVNNDPLVQAYNGKANGGALNPVKGLIMANGGSHITKFLENSPSFGPTILKGLAGAGIQQGSESLEKFLYVMQSSIDVVDPANVAAGLNNTPVVLFNMVGGGDLPAVGPARDAISFPDAFKNAAFVTKYLPDHTVPNYDYFAGENNPFEMFVNVNCFTAPPSDNCVGLGMPSAKNVKSAKAPLAGTDGLASILELVSVNSGAALDAAERTEVRMDKGTHSTFANSDVPAAFQEMVLKSLQLIQAASN